LALNLCERREQQYLCPFCKTEFASGDTLLTHLLETIDYKHDTRKMLAAIIASKVVETENMRREFSRVGYNDRR